MPIPLNLELKKKHSFETWWRFKREDFVAEEVEVDNNIINNPNPAWTKKQLEFNGWRL
jgi:hypothetical protein